MNPVLLRVVLLSPAWTPLRLRAGRVGAWLDPSDFVYMTQDSAGTTASAIAQPVGKIVDRFGFGAHGIQATAAARPTLSARFSGVIQSEDFSNAAWAKNAVTFSTATKLQETTATDAHYAYQATTLAAGVATVTFRLQQAERTWAFVYLDSSSVAIAYFNLAAGTVGTVSGTGSPSASIVAVGDGSYDCTLTATSLNASFNVGIGASTGDGVSSYAGTLNSGIHIHRVHAYQGSTARPYQRVTTATDYDSSGVPLMIDYDTVDDALVCTFPIDMGTNCTVARAVRYSGASILTGQTIATTYSDTTDHCGLVIVNGALNATETAKLTTYLNRKAGV